jgi:hypothetical protein
MHTVYLPKIDVLRVARTKVSYYFNFGSMCHGVIKGSWILKINFLLRPFSFIRLEMEFEVVL